MTGPDMAINGKKQMSPLGLGCWPLGGDQWGPPQDDGDYVGTIRSAYEAGITHFDTAQAYGRGHGEELVGKALKDIRDHVVIATKCMYTPGDKVEAAVNASLKRLQTDFIDIFYIHWPKKGGDLAGMMEALERVRRKGAIRRIGVSNFSIADMREVMKTGTIDYCQLCYNMLWRREERETIPFCKNKSIGIVTYSSLAEGILTGKFGSEPEFPAGDHRKYTALFSKGSWPKVYETVEKLKAAAAAEKVPLACCAVRWLLTREGIVSVLAGARNPEQVAGNVKALDYGIVSGRLLDRMTEISDELAPAIPDAGNIFGWYP
jgi:aryl-alcohol dehydrogenase-like predicted oxidoreductase